MENTDVIDAWSLPKFGEDSIVIKGMVKFLLAFMFLVSVVLLPQALLKNMDNRSRANVLTPPVDTSLINENTYRFELSDPYLTVECPQVGGCFKNLHVKVFNASTAPAYGSIISLQGNWTSYTQAGDVVDTQNKQMYFKSIVQPGGLVYEGDLVATRYDKNISVEYENFSVLPADCRNGGILNGCMPIEGVRASSFSIKFLTTLATATPTPTSPTPTPTLVPDFVGGPFSVRVGTTEYVVCGASDVNCRLQVSVSFTNKSNVPIYMPKFWKVGSGTYIDGNGQTVAEMDSSMHPASSRFVIMPDGDGVSTVITIMNPGVIGTYGGTIYAGGQYCTSLVPTPTNCYTPPGTSKNYTLVVVADNTPTVIPTTVPTIWPTEIPTPTMTPALTITPMPTVAMATPTAIPTPATVAQIVNNDANNTNNNSSSGGSSSSGGGGGGGSSSSSGGGGGGSCGDSYPWGVPYITAITAGNNWARLTFSGKASPVNNYRIWYGEYKNKRAFTSTVSSSSSGVVMAVVNNLKSNTRYYFAIQPINGCKDGVVSAEWYNTTTKLAKLTRTVSRREPVVKVKTSLKK